MAEKYHLLPSDVYQRASFFDIMVTDVKSTYDAYKSGSSEQRANMFTRDASQADLKELMRKAREYA